MNGDTSLDNTIRSALAIDEDRLDIDFGPLKSAKQRLYCNKSDGRINMNSLFTKGRIRVSVVFALVFVLVGGVLGVSAAQLIRTDRVDYSFVNDPEVVGMWESVDFVSFISDFVPGQSHVDKELYLRKLSFVNDGRLLCALNEGNGALTETSVKWTKGLIIDEINKTAGKYKISVIDGSTYMFMEWKTGDYNYYGMEPKYYVLKKVDSSDYSGYKCETRNDNIDYPFVDDPQAVGTWESVDYVRTIDAFDPNARSWLPDFYFKGAEFKVGGKWIGKTADGDYVYDVNWTKGLVLDPVLKTASAYTIKEMDGATYMFYEWKSNDYTMRGMDPNYVVLKKK